MFKPLKRLAATVAAALVPMFAAAQTTEVSFYYPVAVGGPITKLVDSMTADFEKENPGIKMKPIYSGTYQESIVKALTAMKSGEPPVLSVLPAVDRHVHADRRRRNRRLDGPRDQRGRPGVAEELLPGLHGKQ
jgi:ABC-type glycerol-3-phosphate transport system substrate-binding protein